MNVPRIVWPPVRPRKSALVFNFGLAQIVLGLDGRRLLVALVVGGGW